MSATNKTIQSRTVVGIFSAVNEIITLHNSKGAINKNEKMPKHFQQLFIKIVTTYIWEDKSKILAYLVFRSVLRD